MRPSGTPFWLFARSISFDGFAAPFVLPAPLVGLGAWLVIIASTASRAAFWRADWPPGVRSGADQKRYPLVAVSVIAVPAADSRSSGTPKTAPTTAS